ncbi:hypothetical protein TREMEDRAFT_34086 [Tremella mesenterica DSM 1558]|uniref:uncharacterized protein n=1 Tax=Tremella mesenterica (strain ATCC 24925 / CBS 8224 / DSM 1558 / NBRC 9311 / NRRL Y-6157 / RJB 2259-6 / UBC 559-6) TaxID=578456 RepID=UPI0003F4A575|nr:uncharacterized protein TREMEDRAFT_34086 [Tremella mesenterica DSM 1558]EIW67056.1 hypothetical protein TREMEDRAFT_34086 [Tremella mesenterica DSM 1558]
MLLSPIIIYPLLPFLPLLIIFRIFHRRSKPTHTSLDQPHQPLPSLLIPCNTSHSRALPSTSSHSFSYPLLYVGVDIDALSNGSLNSPIFSHDRRLTVLGLRSNGYLFPGRETFREKLESLLSKHDVLKEMIGKVWLITMPSYLGFEGINPLSVWYVYTREGELGWVILEVHNTFGETHAYVLKTSDAKVIPVETEVDKFDKVGAVDTYHWCFPRTFHVSPFNNRNGFYELFLSNPFPLLSSDYSHADQPRVDILLRLLTPNKKFKFQASLSSSPQYEPTSLSDPNILSILNILFRWPFELLSTTPRILYQAFKLQYHKKLAVYPRPEPIHDDSHEEWNPPQEDPGGVGTPLRGLGITRMEKLARYLIFTWAKQRSDETGIGITLGFSDIKEVVDFGLKIEGEGKAKLDLHIRHPKASLHLLTSPSAAYFLVLAPELSTTISDQRLFLEFFAPAMISGYLGGLADHVRRRLFLFLASHSIFPPEPHIAVQTSHWYSSSTIWRQLVSLLVVVLTYLGYMLEERICTAIQVRFVPGREPWKIWERALGRTYEHEGKETITCLTTGSKDEGSLTYV